MVHFHRPAYEFGIVDRSGIKECEKSIVIRNTITIYKWFKVIEGINLM